MVVGVLAGGVLFLFLGREGQAQRVGALVDRNWRLGEADSRGTEAHRGTRRHTRGKLVQALKLSSSFEVCMKHGSRCIGSTRRCVPWEGREIGDSEN